MRFSNVLEMSEEDASRLTQLLESDPLFQKLFRAEHPDWKVFSRARFPGSRLSTSFYEIPEKTQAPSSPEIESVLEKQSGLVEKIKTMGVERYEKYFLYEDGEKTVREISSELGVSEEFVKQVRALTDAVMMNPDFFASKTAPGIVASERSTCLAQIHGVTGGQTEISFFSPGMALGTYKVDYEKLKKLKDSVLTDKEKKSIQDTLRNLEMINSRRTLIFRVLTLLPKWQVAFFLNRDWDHLRPLSQKEAAQELKVTPAAVCRAIQDRSVLVFEDQEVSICEFFPSRKDINKRKLTGFIRGNGALTDKEIQGVLERDFGIKLSRRSVNVYRNEILKNLRKKN